MKTAAHILAILTVSTVSSGQAFAQRQTLRGPVPIYNQAYQETYKSDDIADILARAHGAYVLLDPFSAVEGIAWAQIVAALQMGGNQVGAYISIGTGEDWRADFAALKPDLVKTPWDDWAGEYLVSQPTARVIKIMQARIDKIAALGFDWVEFDNMDWAFDDESRATYGFAATAQDATTYAKALCSYVHEKGMLCMAKNMTDGADSFDGVLYESYADEKSWWDEAGGISFAAKGKLVIINHYGETDCNGVYAAYQNIYGQSLSFICEDANLKKYVHFNQ